MGVLCIWAYRGVLVFGLIFWGGATPDLSLEYFVRVQGLHVSFGVFFFFFFHLCSLFFPMWWFHDTPWSFFFMIFISLLVCYFVGKTKSYVYFSLYILAIGVLLN